MLYEVITGEKKIGVFTMLGQSGFPRTHLSNPFTYAVITSYSIHYTKLYDVPVHQSEHRIFFRGSRGMKIHNYNISIGPQFFSDVRCIGEGVAQVSSWKT